MPRCCNLPVRFLGMHPPACRLLSALSGWPLLPTDIQCCVRNEADCQGRQRHHTLSGLHTRLLLLLLQDGYAG